ncbi:MAG: diacylglycerol kinase family protein [Mucilaginibacter polytrichastri]|nr:diacylglycerol kinase family protein [Mucilaginibacter polytrichastri]
MLRRFFKSIGFAAKGIWQAWSQGRNFRIQCAVTVAVIAAGFWLKVSPFEWTVLLICVALVLSAEVFNTAIERMVDEIHPDVHPKAKLIKDLAAGAVLILSLFSAAVGVLILLPKIL